MTDLAPEQIAGIWATLEGLASRVQDAETRDRYMSDWREHYEAAFPRWLEHGSIVRLPDWKHVGEISDRERRQARKVSDEWVRRARVDHTDPGDVRRFCWEIGRRVGAELLDQEDAREAMAEQLGTGFTSRAAIDAYDRGRRGDGGEGLIASIVMDLRCALFDRNEAGLAERFHARHGHNFRHTTAKGWLKWDGKRWQLLEEERGALPAELLSAAGDTIAAIQREAMAMRATGISKASIPEGADPEKFRVEIDGVKVPIGELDCDDPDAIDQISVTPSTCRLASAAVASWGKAMGELKRYKAMVDMARRWLTVRIQSFDTDPLTINCQNGTLRLLRHADREGVRVEAVLSPHAREDLLTKIAAVPYDPEARCPNYDGTVEWAQPKPAMRRYLHQWGGYNLTGDMGAQIFHVWWGPLAQNGKSTLLDAWADCGGDYAIAGKIETFMEAAQSRGGDAATPALAALVGARMVRTGEPPAGAKFDESLINQITGQDTLQVRDNFRSFFPVRLQIKVTVACNAPPAIPNATEGIKRRVKVVPFEKTMKGALKPDGTPLRDENFKAKLIPELPGVFARLVEGALDWLQYGFVEPQDVTQWTEEYKDENDPIGRFLSYCTELDEGARSQSSHLHKLFEAWSKATGGPKWEQPFFTKKMKAKGYSTKASNGMQWLGIRMIREVSDFVDEHGNVIDLSDGEAPSGGAVSARALSREPPDDPAPDWPADFADDDPLG